MCSARDLDQRVEALAVGQVPQRLDGLASHVQRAIRHRDLLQRLHDLRGRRLHVG